MIVGASRVSSTFPLQDSVGLCFPSRCPCFDGRRPLLLVTHYKASHLSLFFYLHQFVCLDRIVYPALLHDVHCIA